MAYESKREKIGRIFVDLTQKIYGGEIQDNGFNDSVIGNPDIINWDSNQAYESKASISSDHHKINPGQIEHYRNLIENDFPLTDAEVYYFLWQHKKRGVSKLNGREFERTLIENINRLLIVSFDVIEAGSSVWQTTGENSWGEIYMFRSSERRALSFDSESELVRMGLNPNDYVISSEEVSAGTYKYKWWDVPEFLISSVIHKGLKGVEKSLI